MQPLYFGKPEKPIFGIYNDPSNYSRYNDQCVLICPATAHEYMAAHWGLRRIATSIVAEGYHTFQFDYAGTGDSYGEFADVSLNIWVEDIKSAATELLDISENRKLSLIGCRFGGILAALAARQMEIDHLILLESPPNGKSFLSELEKQHKNLVDSLTINLPARPPAEGVEYMGFHYSESLLKELLRQELREIIREVSCPLSIILSSDSSTSATTRDFSTIPNANGQSSTLYTVNECKSWVDSIIAGEQTLIPNELVDTIKLILRSDHD